MKSTNSKFTTGMFLGVLAAAAYGSIPLFTIPLYRQGMNFDSVLFWRYLIAIPIMAIIMIFKKESFRIASSKEALLLISTGIFMGFSSVTLFLSYKYLDVGIASTLLFIYPVLVALIMAIFFKEKMTIYSWLCLLGTVVGIGLLSKSGSGTTISLLGLAIVFLSSIFYATYIVAVNVTMLRTISSLKVIFYVLCFGILVFIASILIKDSFQVPAGVNGWCNTIALAILPTVISFWLTTLAIQYIGATNTAILGAFEPVTGVFVSLFAFNGMLTPRESAGIIMILVCVTFITAGPKLRKLKK